CGFIVRVREYRAFAEQAFEAIVEFGAEAAQVVVTHLVDDDREHECRSRRGQLRRVLGGRAGGNEEGGGDQAALEHGRVLGGKKSGNCTVSVRAPEQPRVAGAGLMRKIFPASGAGASGVAALSASFAPSGLANYRRTA